MPKHPAPRGIIPVEPFTFDEAQQSVLKQITLTEGFGETHWELFEADLEWAIGYYLSYKRLAEASSSASVRLNLRRTLKAATKYDGALAELDSFSRALLQHRAPTIFQEARAHREVLLSAVNYAISELPKSGRRIESEKEHLGGLVLAALRAHTSVEPDRLRGGFFEQVLAFTIRCVGVRKVSDLHTLVERVIRQQLGDDQTGLSVLPTRESASFDG